MSCMMHIDIVLNDFEHKSRYYVHFWTNALTKGMNFLIATGYELNDTTVLLLQGCYIRKVWIPYLKKKYPISSKIKVVGMIFEDKTYAGYAYLIPGL